MKAFILISLAFLSNLIVGCASGGNKNLLEERAGYGFNPPPMNLNNGSGAKYVPTRVPEKVVVAWLHAKELPSKDYFWGSWLSIVVAPEAWEVKKVDLPKASKERTSGKMPKGASKMDIKDHNKRDIKSG
jgi:hypothetical protein